MSCSAGSLARAMALDAIASPFTKSMADPARQVLAFIPVGTPYSTPGLDRVSPPWYMLLGGTYYENAASDILERLNTFEEVVNGISINFEEVERHRKQLIGNLCSKEPRQAMWLLGEKSEGMWPSDAVGLGAVVVRLCKSKHCTSKRLLSSNVESSRNP